VDINFATLNSTSGSFSSPMNLKNVSDTSSLEENENQCVCAFHAIQFTAISGREKRAICLLPFFIAFLL